MKFFKAIPPWLVATLVAALAGSLAQTQFNLAEIKALGAPVPLALRLETTLKDLWGFAPLLAALIAAAYLVAFPVAGLLVRRRPEHRRRMHVMAGATALLAMVLLMNAALPVTAIAATRSMAGILAFMAAGALGGWVFAALASGRRMA
jgi:hypothetical protein